MDGDDGSSVGGAACWPARELVDELLVCSWTWLGPGVGVLVEGKAVVVAVTLADMVVVEVPGALPSSPPPTNIPTRIPITTSATTRSCPPQYSHLRLTALLLPGCSKSTGSACTKEGSITIRASKRAAGAMSASGSVLLLLPLFTTELWPLPSSSRPTMSEDTKAMWASAVSTAFLALLALRRSWLRLKTEETGLPPGLSAASAFFSAFLASAYDRLEAGKGGTPRGCLPSSPLSEFDDIAC